MGLNYCMVVKWKRGVYSLNFAMYNKDLFHLNLHTITDRTDHCVYKILV